MLALLFEMSKLTWGEPIDARWSRGYGRDRTTHNKNKEGFTCHRKQTFRRRRS